MSLPRYEGYKVVNHDFISEIPAHWELRRLKHLAEVYPSNVDKKSYEGQTSVRLCNYTDVYYNDRITGDMPLMAATATAEQVERFTLRADDVVITKDSETADDIAISAHVPEDLPGVVCGYHLAMVRPRPGLCGAFAKRFFDSRFARAQFCVSANGLTRVGLGQYDLDHAVMPTPPTPEQVQIAEFLDRETSKIDVLVAEQRRLMELLEEKRRATIAHAVSKGLNPDAPVKPSGVEWIGEFPAHWSIARIAQLFREVAEPGDDSLPVLSVSIHSGVSDDEMTEEESERKISRSDDRSKYKRVEPGDLAYNMMRAWQGAFGAVTVRGAVSPAYVVARPRGPLATKFVERLLRSPRAIEEMRRRSKGITDFRLRLYWDEFKAMRVVVPPVAEIDHILNAVDELEAEFDELTDACEACIRLLQERRSALISAAVTGQIDVRRLATVEAA